MLWLHKGEYPGNFLLVFVYWVSVLTAHTTICGQCNKMDMECKTEPETAELQVLTNQYKTLCTVLPVDELIPDLITKRVISFEDEEVIVNKQTRYQKAQVLLKEFIVRDVRVGNVSKFYKFLDVLKKNEKCSFLAENIMKDLGAAGTTQWNTTQDAYNLAHAYNTKLGPGTFSV